MGNRPPDSKIPFAQFSKLIIIITNKYSRQYTQIPFASLRRNLFYTWISWMFIVQLIYNLKDGRILCLFIYRLKQKYNPCMCCLLTAKYRFSKMVGVASKHLNAVYLRTIFRNVHNKFGVSNFYNSRYMCVQTDKTWSKARIYIIIEICYLLPVT